MNKIFYKTKLSRFWWLTPWKSCIKLEKETHQIIYDYICLIRKYENIAEKMKSNYTEWQPIETAPKIPSVIENKLCERHTPILLCIAGKEYAEIGGWVSSSQKFYTHGEGFANFTHWMPLPTPPKQ